jgi:hypothetical protein
MMRPSGITAIGYFVQEGVSRGDSDLVIIQ